jgi:hypothetical protein
VPADLSFVMTLIVIGGGQRRSSTWITPGILEALIPGRIQGHGGTAEVSGGAA